ncbi:MAG: threonine-phosphate decarboxylase [Clostridiales bacterium]|nr:threonine-phosphate decarboxylase [Clostridiales bacterium]
MKKYVHGGDIYRYPGVLDFSANINPLGTPQSVIQAAADSMASISHYPDACQEKLKGALAEYEQVPEEWLICGNGAAELIFALVQAIRPKKALIPAPTFAEYEQALRGVECEIQYEMLKDEDGFRMGKGILEKISENLDMMFLCNPNNPTGILLDAELLENILRRCQEKQVWLVVDECFLDFVPKPECHTLKGRLAECDRVFLLKAFTKRYAMAGLRLGYGITANSWLLEAMENRLQPWNVSIPAQEAGVAALGEQRYVERARQIIETEKIFLKGELKKLGCQVYDSQANYIFFKGEPDLCQRLIKEQVMIRDCSNYPGLTQGYFRIAVRTHEENLKLLEALRKVRER